jgi:sigma-B regulation protein RsbU (phosphoserine phosphatase)
VLLDILMPGLDGYEVCRRLRQMPETAEVPIMFLSSLEEVQDKTRGFEAGGNDYLTKPFDMAEVKARVRSLLKAKAYNDAVKEQIASELRVAREIQMGMIPQEFGALERDHGVELAAALEPAREVGGDLYGVFPASGGRLVLVMGDVSGKGIPASLFMVRTCTLVRLLARQLAEPEQILARLNDELALDNPSGMFVTLLCAVYEPSACRLALANGGHPRPVHLRPGQPPRWALENLGTLLGLEPRLPYERTELQLAPGDTVLLYTDGVTEALSPQAACYGGDRLLAGLAGSTASCASDVVTGTLRRTREFASGAPQSDDIALLALRVAPGTRWPPPAPHAGPLSLAVRSTPADLMRAVQQLQQACATRGLAERTAFALMLALEETGSNILHHAYHDDPTRTFQVEVSFAADRATVELRDSGPAFDPLAVPTKSGSGNQEEADPGGWGLQLVRHYMHTLEYVREADRNIFRMSVRLTGDEPPATPSDLRLPA